MQELSLILASVPTDWVWPGCGLHLSLHWVFSLRRYWQYERERERERERDSDHVGDHISNGDAYFTAQYDDFRPRPPAARATDLAYREWRWVVSKVSLKVFLAVRWALLQLQCSQARWKLQKELLGNNKQNLLKQPSATLCRNIMVHHRTNIICPLYRSRKVRIS